MTDYPFPTDTQDGVTFTLLCFNYASGVWYEFVDPDEHDDYLKLECPRTGETISFSSSWDKTKRQGLGSIIIGPADAEKWADLREQYVNADSDVFDSFEEARTELFHPAHERIHG